MVAGRLHFLPLPAVEAAPLVAAVRVALRILCGVAAFAVVVTAGAWTLHGMALVYAAIP